MQKAAITAISVLLGAALIFMVVKIFDGKTIGVNEVGSPKAQTGTITITGVMAGSSQFDKSVIGIMDTKEAECKNGCEKLFIPVKCPDGQQPVAGDEIKATGKFQKLPAGYVFVARKLKVVKHHEIAPQQAPPKS